MSIPHAPSTFPEQLAEPLRRFAETWARSPVRPRPTPECARYWDGLVEAWAADPQLPLFVRKVTNNRGHELQHESGRILIPVDNSPAHWAFGAALRGERPRLDDIAMLVAADRIPVAMVLAADEKRSARYRCTLARIATPNGAGWKLAHIEPIGLATRTPPARLSMESLQAHFVRLMRPSNMFLMPNGYAGLAEIPEVCAAIGAWREE